PKEAGPPPKGRPRRVAPSAGPPPSVEAAPEPVPEPVVAAPPEPPVIPPPTPPTIIADAPAASAAISRSREPIGHDVYDTLRHWDGQFLAQLNTMYTPADAGRLAERYSVALPPAYKAATAVADALGDIRALETL